MKHHSVDFVMTARNPDSRNSVKVDGMKIEGLVGFSVDAKIDALTVVTISFYANVNCDEAEPEGSV
jgi:hypothetical protein